MADYAKSYNGKLLQYLDENDIQPMTFANIVQIPPREVVMMVLDPKGDMTKEEYDSFVKQVDIFIRDWRS